jgi:hypothetical protein
LTTRPVSSALEPDAAPISSEGSFASVEALNDV